MKKIKVHIEITKESNIKYEYNRKTKKIEVDRILRKGFFYPANYGYIAEALDWDGDELDVLVFSKHKFMPGVSINAKIIGAIKMIDDGETDTKLIVVHSDDYDLKNINKLDDVPKRWLKEVETFFTTYKNWKGVGITKVFGFEDESYAIKEYNECVELMQKYGNLNKNDFINKMKKIRPDKYEIVQK